MGRILYRVRLMHFRLPIIALALILTACARVAPADLSAGAFLEKFAPYCGQAYQGQIVSDDPEDEAWRSETVIAELETCTDENLRIPVYVGDDFSRTWLIGLNDDGRLALRHQHLHEDGTPDAITMYGGKSSGASDATRQVFPADRKTMDLFEAQDIPESKANIWAMEIDPDAQMLAYELKRPNRYFRIEFDLSKPVEAPARPE